MSTIHFFQPQYATKQEDGSTTYWLPYSVACLWAYASQFSDIKKGICLGGLHFRRDPIDKIIPLLQHPTICAFSCYVWNEQYCLALAQKIKTTYPTCVIVFGGPQTNGNYLRHNFIDSLVFAEGEENMVEIIRCVLDGQKPKQIYDKKRLNDLDVPSPYLLGLFDPLINKALPHIRWQTVIETNRGCPYACTFCDWGSLTYNKVKKFQLSKIEKELQWIRNKPIVSINIADANFGLFKERDIEIAKLFQKNLQDSMVDYVNFSYAKNSHETVFQIAKILGPLTKSVTLSMQSMNPATLKVIKRDNLKTNQLQEMLRLSKQYDVPTHTEMILGLPEETFGSWSEGLCDLLEMGQHNWIDVYFTSLLENSELNQLQRQMYKMQTVRATNYMLGSIDDDGLVEHNEVVCATSTMSRDDMCRSYMYNWMIQNFHLAGYTQQIAKYYRHVFDISYKDFYDLFFKKLQHDRSSVGDHYRDIASICHKILRDGDTDDHAVEIHDFFSRSSAILYDLIPEILQLTKDVGKCFGPLDPSVESVQQQFVINRLFPANLPITTNFNLETWEPQICRYQLIPKYPKIKISAQNMVRYRRRGWMKHALIRI